MRNRVVLGGLLLYLLTPVDLIPDFVPIIGWLDDAFVMLVILDYVFNSADTDLLLQHYPWNKRNFAKMKSYVERLAWLVPPKVRSTLFREASRLAISKQKAERLTKS